MDAAEKIDFWSALTTSLLITASFASTLGGIYAMAYFGMIEFSVLQGISFPFVVFSMISTFNLTFALTVLDQLHS